MYLQGGYLRLKQLTVCHDQPRQPVVLDTALVHERAEYNLKRQFLTDVIRRFFPDHRSKFTGVCYHSTGLQSCSNRLICLILRQYQLLR